MVIIAGSTQNFFLRSKTILFNIKPLKIDEKNFFTVYFEKIDFNEIFGFWTAFSWNALKKSKNICFLFICILFTQFHRPIHMQIYFCLNFGNLSFKCKKWLIPNRLIPNFIKICKKTKKIIFHFILAKMVHSKNHKKF